MENNYQNEPTGLARYGRRNIGKWIFIYLIIGAIVYGIIYFVMAMNGGGYNDNSQQYPTGYNNQIPANQNSAEITSDQNLQSVEADLDSSNIGQIDTGLNQNDMDAKTF